MLKGGGKVLGLIFILIFCILFAVVEDIKEVLPDPILGELGGWELDIKNSTRDETFFSAKLTISNQKGDLLIKIIEKITRFDVYYSGENSDKIEIGKVSFTSFQDKKQDSSNNLIQIESNEEKNITIYFMINNDNFIIALKDHIIKNNEIGEIEFQLNFSFFTNLRHLGFDIRSDIPTFESKTIKTDILHIFDEIKYIVGIPENYTGLTPDYPILDKLFTFSAFKENNSSIILVNRSINLLRNHTKTLFNIYLGEKLEWISNYYGVIQMKQKIIVTGNSIWLIFFKLMLPKKMEIKANNIDIGEIEINKPEETRLGFLYKKITYEPIITIDDTWLDRCIERHVKNNGLTNLTLNIYGEDTETVPISLHPSQLGNIKINRSAIDWSGFKTLLSRIQYLFILGITGITTFILTSYYLKRKTKKSK